MRKLFEAIQRFLAQRFGITEDRTYFQDYNNTFTIKCTVKMVPDGKKVEEDVNLYCSFYFNESNRRAKGGQRTVTFGDYKYRRPLEYVDKIVVDMLKRLPAKLEEENARWLASSRRAEAAKIGALLQGTGLFMSSDSCTDGLILSFRHHDKLTVMEAANFLQDNGFCGRTSERPPQADEVKFIVRNMLDLFNLLTEEERFAFLQNLPMDLITAVHLNQTTEAQS